MFPLLVVINRIVSQVNWTIHVEGGAETTLAVVGVVVAHTTGASAIIVGGAVLVGVASVSHLVGHAVVEVMRIAAGELAIIIIHQDNDATEVVVVILGSLSSGSLSSSINWSSFLLAVASGNTAENAFLKGAYKLSLACRALCHVVSNHLAGNEVVVLALGINKIASSIANDGVAINGGVVVKELVANDFDRQLGAIGLSNLDGSSDSRHCKRS